MSTVHSPQSTANAAKAVDVKRGWEMVQNWAGTGFELDNPYTTTPL